MGLGISQSQSSLKSQLIKVLLTRQRVQRASDFHVVRLVWTTNSPHPIWSILILHIALVNPNPSPMTKTYVLLAQRSLSLKHFLISPCSSAPLSPPSRRPPITSNHISSDLWSVTCVGIRCHACLSITQILIDKIPRPYIPCPFKGYRQRMLRIDTDLICHWPRRGTANKAHGNTAEKNSSWLTGLVWSFATKPVVLQIWFLFHISNQIKSCGRTGFTAIARNSLSEYDHISR